MEQFKIDISSNLKSSSQIELMNCTHCHLQFFSPAPSAPAIYSRLPTFDWYYMQAKWEYNCAMTDLADCGKILEIGCGSGHFMLKASAEKPFQIEGIETSQKAVYEAQQRGLSVHNFEIVEASKKLQTVYDAVCSFQVLEHVSNPEEFIRCSCDLLSRGGKMILGLPNADSFLKFQFNILDMPPHHMTRWSTRTLSVFSELFPLRLERIDFEPLAPYHIDGYVNAYSSNIEKRIPSLCRGRIGPKSFLRFLVKRCRFYKLLRGQSLYAVFRKM